MNLSHKKYLNKSMLLKKSIVEIKNLAQTSELQEWFFTATLLTSPQTRVVQSQIRQAIFVFEPDKPQQILIVVLSEPAVRKYCNILQPFSQINFINGAVKRSHLNNIFVLITKQSILELLQEQNQIEAQKLMAEQKGHRTNLFTANPNIKLEQSERSLSINSNLQIFNHKSSPQEQRFVAKSEKIEMKRQNVNIEFQTFCGTVLVSYNVGKGKANHGIGYRIEQCFSKLNYEVVIWSDMEYKRLKNGESYEFSNFRRHKKHNLEISYHSHPQYSSVTALI